MPFYIPLFFHYKVEGYYVRLGYFSHCHCPGRNELSNHFLSDWVTLATTIALAVTSYLVSIHGYKYL